MFSRKKSTHRAKGFTLVELIVTIVIILILASVLVPAILRYVSKAQQAAAIACAKQFETAYEASVAEFIAEGVYHKDIDVTHGYAYEAITNNQPAPSGGRSLTLYNAMNAGAVPRKFEAIGLYNLTECKIELMRFKDFSLDMVFECTPGSGWHIMEGYTPNGAWTTEFSNKTNTGEIYWNNNAPN